MVCKIKPVAIHQPRWCACAQIVYTWADNLHFPSCVCMWPYLDSGISSCEFFPNRVPGMPQAQVGQLQVDLFNLVYSNRARGREAVNVILLDVWRANTVGRGCYMHASPPLLKNLYPSWKRGLLSLTDRKRQSRQWLSLYLNAKEFCQTEVWKWPIAIFENCRH